MLVKKTKTRESHLRKQSATGRHLQENGSSRDSILSINAYSFTPPGKWSSSDLVLLGRCQNLTATALLFLSEKSLFVKHAEIQLSGSEAGQEMLADHVRCPRQPPKFQCTVNILGRGIIQQNLPSVGSLLTLCTSISAMFLNRK